MNQLNTILFTNAHLNHEPGLCDLLVEDGRFLEIGPCLNKKYPIGNVCDLNGKLVLPPFVDSHIHLDYVYTAGNLARTIVPEPFLRGLNGGPGENRTGPWRK